MEESLLKNIRLKSGYGSGAKKGDEILIGADYSIEDHNTYNNNFGSEKKYISSGEFGLDQKSFEVLSFVKNTGSKLILLVFILLLIFGFFYFLKQIMIPNSSDFYSISKTTMLFVVSYFSLAIILILLLFRKKKIHLEVRGGYLHIRSFPSLNQKIPVSKILSCKVNSFNSNQNFANSFQLALSQENNRFSFNLESGLTVKLSNGKEILFGSSASQQFQHIIHN